MRLLMGRRWIFSLPCAGPRWTPCCDVRCPSEEQCRDKSGFDILYLTVFLFYIKVSVVVQTQNQIIIYFISWGQVKTTTIFTFKTKSYYGLYIYRNDEYFQAVKEMADLIYKRVL